MRLLHLAFAALTALSLVGCTAPTASSDAPKAPVSEPAVAPPVAPPPAVVAAPPAQNAQTPVTSPADTNDTTKNKPGFDASNPSRSCRTDSDCVVKDVGNCCGYFPMCVNKDARTDPAAVRAQCEKDGMASICGFQEVSGCQCVQGRCENITDGSAVM